MRIFIHFFIIACLSRSLNAQITVSSKFSVKPDTVSVERYTVPEIKTNDIKDIFFKVKYGEFDIVNYKEAEKLINATILTVDLVYTKFPANEDFSELNRRRIGYLNLICPSIFNNTMAAWRIVAQTSCKSEYAASSMAHGFYIKYKPGPTKESAGRELSYLKGMLENKVALEDSGIYKIFKRNKWKNISVVSDFTGSMSPYIGQVLLWYNLTYATKDFKEFVFFNDGDLKEDAVKKIGSTGGIYYCKSGNKDSVLKAAFSCSKNGYGGDIQENNIEAALLAVKKKPMLKEIIMLVDNWAPMRDYALMSQIKIPVHVIVCGKDAHTSINTEYLDLAHHTKGSIHTVEEDIHSLSTLAEGKSVTIDSIAYKVIGGRFVKLKS